MKNPLIKQVALSLFVVAVACSARAGGLTNNFAASYDYVANGIIGDTNWDGVYLRFGDISGGDNGGDGNGVTLQANETTFAGFLTVETTMSTWAAPGDDGFLVYKWVSGDFDASVGVAGPWNNADINNYHFAGLMARAANRDGSAYGGSENSVSVTRFQKYGTGDKIFYALNGADNEYDFNGADTNTAYGDDRYYRIQRVGNVFNCYYATNSSKVWSLLQSFTNSNLAGVPIQVGLMQTMFTANSAQAYFTDFEVQATNVSFPTMPAAPASLVTTATNTLGALTFSWTTNGGDGSLVVMSRRPIQHNPVQGIVYNASSIYGDANALLGGAGEFVVYSGPATSVTVTNLGANNLTYYVAVFSYATASPPVYNTAGPATGSFVGPGIITGASLEAVGTNNIPAGGAVVLKVLASFSTGETSDQSASATWSSSDASIAAVDTAGTVSGIAVGVATITATFGSFTPSTNITVHSAVFTDNFAVTQNYVANGLQGSTWDGLFLNYGDVPGANKGSDLSPGQTFQLIANTNALYLQAAGGTWRYIGSDGTYLFKIVTGDFQAGVHVTCGVVNNNYAGIMARLFNSANGGGGGGSGGTETHINWGNPQQGTPSARLTIDSGGTTTVDGLTTDRWLLMQRVNSTNFYFYEKSSAAALWSAVPAATMVLPEAAASAPMEVGLFEEMRTASTDTAQFDTLMIDGPGIVSPAGTPPPPAATGLTATLNPDLSMTFSWVATNNAGSPVASILVMRAGGPVTAQPTYGLAPGYGGAFGAGLSLGDGNYVVARSSSSPTTVTITGLTPGTTYYAAVYTFAGTYPDRVYNSVLPATGATANLLDGVLQSVFVTPVPSIPLGGLQLAQVFGVYGGIPVNVSAFATITIANPNVVQLADGALTGIGLGSTTAEVVFGGVTNTMSLTVRAPSFVDEFGVNHGYLASGVAGTTWDGMYDPNPSANPIPGSPYVPLASSGATVADANISSNNILTLTAAGDGWENDTCGFFLFKYVPGDFQTAVHINSFDIADYNQPGLLARAYSYGTNGTTRGAPFVIGPARTNKWDITISTYGESWVSLCRFDLGWGIGSYARLTLDSATDEYTQPDLGDNNFWLLMVRSGGTDFSFYKRLTNTAPWRLVPNKTAFHQTEFAGTPMQVGLMAGPWTGASGTQRTVMFEHFMLDLAPVLQVSRSGSNAILSWPNAPGVVLKSTVSLKPTNWQLVGGTPTTNGEVLSISVPMTNAASFFRLFY